MGFLRFDFLYYPSDYSRKILLISDKGIYSIDINPLNRPDVEEAIRDLNLNLRGVGYKVEISKDALPKGNYKIYLYYDLNDGTKWVLNSEWSVINTNWI